MTEIHRPSQPSNPGTAGHSGRKVSVSTVQVGASAAAAVTSALAASVFGVAGTLIGAAVGSMVSTIAAALYADYLHRAGRQLRVTKSVVIQRIPSEMLAATPLRHLTGPADLPGEQAMRAIGDETAHQTVTLPLADQTELLESPASPAARAWYKRPVLAMGLCGFLIALGIITASEGAIGHSLSGGDGQTSISKAFDHSSDTSKDDVTPTPAPTTATPTPTTTPDTTTALASGSATAAPTATPSTAPAAAGETPAPTLSTPSATDAATPDSAST
jgi:hypothetical protein